jgi:hypothetical protein
MGKKKRAPRKMQDSEVVRAKYAQNVKSKGKTKLQEALELSEKLKDPIDVPKTGKIGEWFGRFAGFGYAASCILMSISRITAYMGKMPGYNTNDVIKMTIALSPLFFGSAALWFVISEIWLLVKRNPIRQRRVNILALCSSVGICSLLLVPVSIGAPLYLFGCPISVVAMAFLFFRQVRRDNSMIEPLPQTLERRILKVSIFVLALMAVMFVVHLILSYSMADYMKSMLDNFQAAAASA